MWKIIIGEYDGHIFHRGKCISCEKCAEVCFLSALEMAGTLRHAEEVIDEVND